MVEMEPKSPSKSKNQLVTFARHPRLLSAGIFLLFLLILVLAGRFFISKTRFNHYSSNSDYKFTVVLDCGSTGSRVNVYKWLVNGWGSYSNLPVLVQSYPENFAKSHGCQYHCLQTEPGLDKFVGNLSGVRVSLTPLIRFAEQWVPSEKHKVTPIFVLATAGMRRLSFENARWVLKNVEDVIQENSFLYRKQWIRVLSGKEEAYYGWLALNYKMGVFGNMSRSPSLGLLDLGGSSLQVVTEVDEFKKDEQVFISKIDSFAHSVLAYSLPTFGLNEAFDRTVVLLSHSHAIRQSGNGIFEIRHPCLSSSFMQNYTCNSCYRLNNVSSKMEGSDLISVLLVGHQNWEKCKLLARAAAVNSSNLELSWLEDRSKCIGFSPFEDRRMLNLTAESHSVRHFHALSGFFAVYKKLNLSSKANLTRMWEMSDQLCSKSKAEQTSISGVDCFQVPYIVSLIEDALCLRNIEINFGPGDISWTLGAALVEGSYLWRSADQSRTGILSLKKFEFMSSPVFIFILLLSLLLIVYHCQIKLPMLGRKISPVRASVPSYSCSKRQPN